MAETIGTAYVQIEPSFEGSVQKIEKQMGGAGQTGGKSFTSGFGSVMKGFGVATVAAGAAIGAMGAKFASATSDVADYGDHIDKMSQKMGISAEAYQEWDAVMQHSGTSIDALKPAMKTLAVQAEKGGAAFEKLGISEEQVKNLSTEDLFAEVITGLQGMEEGTERTYLTSQLLGRGATELGALLNTSAEETQAMRDRVHELGGVMSDEAVKASAAFTDQMQDLQTAFQGISRNMMAEFLPAITEIMGGLTEIFSGNSEEGLGMISNGINELVSKITEAIPQIAQTAVQIVEALASGIISNLPTLVQTGFEMLSQLVDYILQNLPMIIEVGLQIITELATGIAQALPTLIPQIVETVMQIIQTFVDNLPQLIDCGIQLIMSLIEGIINAIPILISHIPEIIVGIVEALVQALPQLIQGAIELVHMIVANLPAIIQALIEAIPEIIVGIVQALTEPENVEAIIMGAIQLVVALVAALPQIIMALIEAIPQIIVAIVQAFSQMDQALIQLFTQIMADLGPTFNVLGQYAATAWQAIQSAFASVGSWFKSKFTAGVNGIKNAFSSIGSFFQGIWNKIVQVFSGAAAKFKEIGTQIVNGIKEGIAGTWESLKSFLSNICGDLIALAKRILGIKSPSKVFAEEIGQWIPAGIAVGIQNGMGVLDETFDNMAGEMLNNSVNAKIESSVAHIMPGQIEAGTASGNAIELLSTYLPIIAAEISKPIEVNQNDRGTFNAVRAENNKLRTATGYHALA